MSIAFLLLAGVVALCGKAPRAVDGQMHVCWFRFHGQFTDWRLDWIAETCSDYARRFL